jgi:hypothetical protein
MGDAEIANAGAAALLGLPVPTKMTIKTASDAEAARTFINVGSRGRMLGKFCIVSMAFDPAPPAWSAAV